MQIMEQVVKAINSSTYRKIKGIRQSELAKEIGVSCATMSSWEQGKSLPNADQLYRLAIALGVAMEELCVWEK